jgi:adenylate cyclase
MSSLSFVFILFGARSSIWTDWDYKILDIIFSQAVKYGHGPQMSPQIVYITITDNSYNYFGKNILDRADVANINNALSELGVEAVIYDIIFARPGKSDSDQKFKTSIDQLGSVYLPIGLAYSPKKQPFKWETGIAYERFRSDYLRRPVEKGSPNPFYATTALMQSDAFSEAAFNSGHISAFCDPDGVYRHIIMLLKVDGLYFPTLTLSTFLDYARVSFDDIVVHWGEKIVIPSTKENLLDHDVIIPIDDKGRAFIPFTQVWGKDFKKMEAHSLLQYFDNEDLRGNLTEIFEGKFVFIGDVSVGTSDLGRIPLEHDAPLIITHTSMLNGLLTNTFYSKTSFWHVILIIFMLGCLLCASALPRSSWFLYVSGVIILLGLIGLTWFQFIHFHLFPIVTVGASFLFIFFALVIGIEILVSKEKTFIKNAFSRYVPEKVVKHLLDNPEMLKLGGEERVITVLFSDIESFTTISENMNPPELARLLNEYLTEMTNIILEEGGIIDKYEGDAIMAEFGAPITAPNHADMAVRTGLRMQRRLQELRKEWSQKGLPALRCRVGINTGSMIIGNMGSDQVFDYTVIGDAVNLASRLERANKLYNTYLMISEFTYDQISPGIFKTRVLDVITVKGKTKAVKVFEVYGETLEQIESEDELYYKTYNEAFEAYLLKDFSRAMDKFRISLSLRPADPASENMISRIHSLNLDQLSADWDGSVALK